MAQVMASNPPILPAAASAAAGPLSPENVAQLKQARDQGKKLRRAAGVATFSAWSMAVFAALTLPLSLVFGLWNLVFAVVLGLTAAFEFRGAAGLRRLDVRAPRLLMLNELALGMLLACYGAWQLIASLTGPNPYAAAIASNPDLREMLGPIGELARSASIALYGSVIAVGVLYQPGMAIYYATRGRQLKTYLQTTPPWIVDLQRSGVSIQ
jgi:hypothetical protein